MDALPVWVVSRERAEGNHLHRRRGWAFGILKCGLPDSSAVIRWTTPEAGVLFFYSNSVGCIRLDQLTYERVLLLNRRIDSPFKEIGWVLWRILSRMAWSDRRNRQSTCHLVRVPGACSAFAA